MKVFVPIDDQLMERLGLTLDDLVPFDLDYEVLRSPIPTESTEAATQSTVEPA